MNYKTTLGLLVLLAAVGTYFYFIERDRPAASPPGSAPSPAAQRDTPLFTADALSTESVDRLILERGDDRWVLEKIGSDWWQTEPVRFKLNAWSASSLIDLAATIQRHDTLQGRTLDQPVAVVTLHDSASDRTHVLRLGQTTIGGRAELALDDDPTLLLVSDALHRRMGEFKINDLRARTLDAPASAQAASLTLERDGQTLALHKADDGSWHLDPAHTQRAAAAEVERLITGFSRLGIDRFVEDNPDRLDHYGLDSPRLTVTLTTPDRTLPDSDRPQPGERHTLTVGRPADLDGNSFFAVRADGTSGGNVVFTVTKASLEPFAPSADALRDARVFTVEPDQVTAMALRRDGTALELARDTSGRFLFTQPPVDFHADYNDVTDLIAQITAIQADVFKAPFTPSGAATATISLGRESATIYPADDGGYWALRAGETVAGHLRAEAVAPLLSRDAASLRDRTVLDLKADDLQAVTLAGEGRPTLRFTRGDDKAWSLEGFEDFERGDFEQLLLELAPLRADRWAGGDAQPGPVDLELKLQTADNRFHAVAVTQTHAFVEGGEEVFTIGQALRRRLNGEYRPRALLSMVAEDIASVMLAHAGETRTITLQDNQFTWNDPAPLQSAAAAALFETLAGLKADRFVAPPASIDEPAGWTITITPHDGPARTLKLSGDGRTATLEPGHEQVYRDWFTLDDPTWKKLTADLAGTDQPLPDAAELMQTK